MTISWSGVTITPLWYAIICLFFFFKENLSSYVTYVTCLTKSGLGTHERKKKLGLAGEHQTTIYLIQTEKR